MAKNTMQEIRPTKIRHIKLGLGGEWAEECIERTQTVRLGFDGEDHDLCLAGKWQAINRHFQRQGHNRSTSSRLTNEIREFYEADDNLLWVTFYDHKLWWCFSEPAITLLPDKTKTRSAIGRWKCESIDGTTLDFKHLSKELLKKRMFNGTICKVNESYVLKKVNGHAKNLGVGEDDAVVEAVEKSLARSQGFQLDSRTRKAIEDYSMDEAKKHFKSLGYTVEDHSKNHSYDLLCTKKNERLHVEVKGTMTSGYDIMLTRGEVKFARSHKEEMGLFILHSIKVSVNGKLSNGQVRVIVPWDVGEGRLKPISFMYQVP